MAKRQETVSVHINGDRAYVTRAINGQVIESYRPGPLELALADAALVIMGFEPAKHFARLDNPSN